MATGSTEYQHLGFTPGQVITLTDAHNLRNARTYRSPIPPITGAEAQGVVSLLEAALPKVNEIVARDSKGRT